MTLTLRAVALDDHPLTQPITVHFDALGGTIGRADHNTLTLPDPKRHISRQQAEVKAADGAYAITNVGSANPIVLGSRTLACGESAPLAHGDRLLIGGYRLEVEVGEGAGLEAATLVRGRAAVDAATALTAVPAVRAVRAAAPAATEAMSFGNGGGVPLSPGNPFAGLFDGADPARAAPSHPRARLPDDFDPFAAPPVPPPAAVSPADAPCGAFDDLIPAATDFGSIDRLFGLVADDGRDPLAAFLDGPAPAGQDPAAAPAARVSTDPLALFGAPVSAPPPEGRPTASDHVPALRSSFAPPRLARSPAPPPPAEPAVPPTTRDPAAGPAPPSAWAAFCEGAGVRVERAGFVDDAEAMRELGAVLRAAIDGTLRLMAVRASAKHELRAPVTVIRPQRNNPLKFSPDVDAALAQLLQPPVRGFLPGPAAVRDAMDDLVGHAIGTLAGTRAALEGVLDRFAPGQLEAKLAARSVLDSVLPMNRKARLWELYLQHFETIRGEAQDDFHSLFGRAFLAAYEAQLDRLHESPAAPAGADGAP